MLKIFLYLRLQSARNVRLRIVPLLNFTFMNKLYVKKSNSGSAKYGTHLLPLDDDRMFIYLASSLWQDVVFFCLHVCDNVPDLLVIDGFGHSVDFYYHNSDGSLELLFKESLRGFFHRMDDFYLSVAPFFSGKMKEFMLDVKSDPLLFYGHKTSALREYWCK